MWSYQSPIPACAMPPSLPPSPLGLTPDFVSAFCTVYPRSAALPVSWGGIHSRVALESQTSTNLILCGGPGLSEKAKHGTGHGTTHMCGNGSRSAPSPLLSYSSLHPLLCPTLSVWEPPWIPQLSVMPGDGAPEDHPISCSPHRTDHQDVNGCSGL